MSANESQPVYSTITFKVIAAVVFTALVGLVSVGVTLYLSWQLEGNAAAINDAGRLRMRSYRLELLLLEWQKSATEDAAQAIHSEVGAIDETYAVLRKGDATRPLFLPNDKTVKNQLEYLSRLWVYDLKPAVERSLTVANKSEQDKSIAAYHSHLDDLVKELNKFVDLIEDNNASRTLLLRSSQLTLSGVLVAGVVVAIYFLFLMVIRPILRLLNGMEKMTAQDFSVRVPVEANDEFGDLSRGFNQMADKLQESYATLENRVEEKTRALAAQNRELSSLYEITAFFQEANLTIEETCKGFLTRIQRIFAADGGTVRLLNAERDRAHIVVHSGISENLIASEFALPVGRGLCGHAIAENQQMIAVTDSQQARLHNCEQCAEDGFKMVSLFQVRVKGEPIGFFNLHFKELHQFTVQEMQLLEALGQHLGIALENLRLKVKEKEMAISQERNLVAQGLHDSIAQGLSFLNLQVQMLEESLANDAWYEAREILPLLKAGVQESYEDVRELLLNFRSRIDAVDLFTAISMTLEKFERQSHVTTEFSHSGEGAALSREQQLQVVFILQEALSNVRKHAQATLVRVILENKIDFKLLIQDNGVGFDESLLLQKGDTHYGLKIMQERAQRILGELVIHSKKGEGTRLELVLRQENRLTA
ncbi:MAG TPA: type IV pili methyl-accepting chemotaxis transducer N-terminal domain-containing protein [Pseudomonadales bacterium]|nr:type IV pili methyl-accepting chemotaxis transducer N-terminal domain-containing protein [Pseudomonadales bacterium]